jgi:thioredoxin 1
MSERLLVLALVVLALSAVGWWLSRRPRALAARLREATSPARYATGRPLVLAFTSSDCAACRGAQRPALEELRARLGAAVDIREVDVLADQATARAFGIISVPSTAVLDAAGRVVAFNTGFAPAGRLLAQIRPTRNGEGSARS